MFTTACEPVLPDNMLCPGLRAAFLALTLSALSAAAFAQAALSGLDKQAPIEITADTLVVKQQEQIATFSGNVDATQGDLSLRADELKVFYADEKSKAAGGGAQAIRRIEAVGHVVVTAPEQTATGDRGAYDVAQGRISLEGNVVLTRGDDVIHGGSADLELASNVATVRAAKGGVGGTERVRALFRPEPARPPAAGRKEPVVKKER